MFYNAEETFVYNAVSVASMLIVPVKLAHTPHNIQHTVTTSICGPNSFYNGLSRLQ
jgi:hypothetical protein